MNMRIKVAIQNKINMGGDLNHINHIRRHIITSVLVWCESKTRGNFKKYLNFKCVLYKETKDPPLLSRERRCTHICAEIKSFL